MSSRHVEALDEHRKRIGYTRVDPVAFAIASLADAVETAAQILKDGHVLDDFAEKERMLMEDA